MDRRDAYTPSQEEQFEILKKLPLTDKQLDRVLRTLFCKEVYEDADEEHDRGEEEEKETTHKDEDAETADAPRRKEARERQDEPVLYSIPEQQTATECRQGSQHGESER